MSHFAQECQFTQTYQQYQHAHPALREAACLQVQFPAILTPLQADDVIAGALAYPAIGFSPQYWHSDWMDRTGYYCDEPRLRRELANLDLPARERDDVEAMIAFWREESTVSKIRGAFSPVLQRELPVDNWVETSGVSFPLYRMAGVHLDYGKLLRLGLPGLKALIYEYRDKPGADTALYDGMAAMVDLVADCAHEYARQADDVGNGALATVLRHIAVAPPETLHQAIQLMWLTSILASYNGNYGRMDVYFGDFLAADLQNGRLTSTTAFTLLTSLWQKFLAVKRDGQVIIGGIGRRNEANADAFALLALDVQHAQRDLYPQLSLRFYEGQNPRLYQKALDMLGDGLTFPMLYNDDVNVPAVQHAFDVSPELALRYVPFGCGEFVLEGHSFGTPSTIINMPKVLELTLFNGQDPVSGEARGLALGTEFATFDDLWTAYTRQMQYHVDLCADMQTLAYDIVGQETAHLFFSMLHDGPIERGRSMFDGGMAHLGGSLETYGNITTADSLTAIQQVVYENGRFSLNQLRDALSANFVGYTDLHRALQAAPKFGNDDPTADGMAQRVHDQVCRCVRDERERTRLDSFLVVIINNSASVIFGKQTAASANGRFAQTPLTNGNTPANGEDRNGPTALFNSMVKLDPTCHAGASHNMKFNRDLFTRYRPKLEALLRGYFRSGGTQAMLTVVSLDDLRRAQQHPEQYQNLLVRVGGFSARFVDLGSDVQAEIMTRTMIE